ncbi:CPBP family intramembrane glutamic endopeptidase [Tumidithrix elongata RA019]|uniref:CPBP family intramembrane glutamic endopeptidase n=1 Tax=Tumidithrix elongata BACA0141 TaxID=2716417 RepID=A0AAW9Q1L9_9CYAN|nr:CPBP family intramembrane glutamic endopeptidase [Tumidithrix elongata RA019]
MNLPKSFQSVATYPAPVRLGLFLLLLATLWLPIAAPIFLIFGDRSGAYLVVFLYSLFIWLIGEWGRKVVKTNKPYTHYGLVFNASSGRACLLGISLGATILFALMQVQVFLGWQSWQGGADWQGAILAGLLTGVGVGFAEELLFRGWFLTELNQDYGKGRSLWICSILYAVLHFLKPIEFILASWVQFPGLVLLGICLVLARHLFKGSLGFAIGLHGGLVWGYYIVNTTHWLKPTQAVSELFTGINGNPLAGLLGLAFLTILAVGLKFSRVKFSRS